MNNNKLPPLIAIWMVTYNHERYIGQAINSIINQKTHYTYKLFIGEDCSTDNTRNICEEYVNKYPDLIEVISTSQNDIEQNVENIFNATFNSGAKYIAMLEGDDYWIDENKLQRQVDYLETHPGIIACAHNVDLLYVHNNEFLPSELNVTDVKILTLNETGFHTPAHTCSLLFRNMGITPARILKGLAGDWLLISLLLAKGDLVILPDTMAVYRQNAGIWGTKSRSKQLKGIITTIDLMLSAPEFDGYAQFKFNLLWTKIDYLKEIMAAGEDVATYQREISMMQYYEGLIDQMQEVYKDGKKLSSKTTIPTLYKALQAKIYRSFKKK